MINYNEEEPLISYSLPTMFRIFKKFKSNSDICWPVKGRPSLLSNKIFMEAVNKFEHYEGRAVGKNDMDPIL